MHTHTIFYQILYFFLSVLCCICGFFGYKFATANDIFIYRYIYTYALARMGNSHDGTQSKNASFGYDVWKNQCLLFGLRILISFSPLCVPLLFASHQLSLTYFWSHTHIRTHIHTNTHTLPRVANNLCCFCCCCKECWTKLKNLFFWSLLVALSPT